MLFKQILPILLSFIWVILSKIHPLMSLTFIIDWLLFFVLASYHVMYTFPGSLHIFWACTPMTRPLQTFLFITNVSFWNYLIGPDAFCAKIPSLPLAQICPHYLNLLFQPLKVDSPMVFIYYPELLEVTSWYFLRSLPSGEVRTECSI